MGNELKKFIIGKDDGELFAEIKACLNLKAGDETTLMSEAKRYVVISKTAPVCFTCGAEEDLHTLGNDIILCGTCLKSMCSVAFKGMYEEEVKAIADKI